MDNTANVLLFPASPKQTDIINGITGSGSADNTSGEIQDQLKNEAETVNDINNSSATNPAIGHIITMANATVMGVEKYMDEKDFQRQYMDSLDRNLSEIRKESSENRREIKNDIHHYIDTVAKKFDDSMDIMNRGLDDLSKKINRMETTTDAAKRHIDTVGVGVILGLIATLAAIIFKT